MPGPWEKYAQPAQQGPWQKYATPTPTDTDFEKQSRSKGRAYQTVKEAVAGPFRAVKNMAVGTIDAAKPRDAAESITTTLNPFQPIGNIVAHTVRDVAGGTVDAWKKANQAMDTGESDAGTILSFAENLPMIGSLVQKAEQGAVSPTPGNKLGTEANYFTPDQVGAASEGSTYVALPELQKRLPGAVAKATEKVVPKDMQQSVREYMGLGDRMVKRTAEKSTAQHAEDVANVQAKNEAATQKYQSQVDKVNQKQAQIDKQTNLQNQQAAREWYEQTRQAQDLNDLQKEQVGQRAALGNKIAQSSTKLGTDVRALEEAVRNRGNSLYDVVTDKVGNSAVPADTLAKSVRYAEDKILSGSAENIKQFRELVKKGEGQEVQLGGAASGGVGPGHPLYQQLQDAGVIPATENLTFRDLQGYYTELGQKLASGNVPGDVYRAVKYVREQIGNQMDSMAKSAGVLDDLNRAKAYWRQYEDTFHNMRPMSQGGSPVARVLRANPDDPGFVAAPLTGKASARAVTMLSKYDPDLAQVAAQIAKDTEAAKKLPSSVKPRTISEAPEPSTPRTLQKPTPPTLTPEPEAPNLANDVTAARQAKVIKIASGLRSVSGWDLASMVGGAVQLSRGELPTALGVTIIRHGVGRWLDRPEVIDWLSKPTERDFNLLRQFSAGDQNTIRQGITQAIVKQVRSGNQMDPDSWKGFLKPAQITAIANASPRYHSASDIMEAMKNGELDQKSGNAMLQRIKGKSGVITRPLPIQ